MEELSLPTIPVVQCAKKGNDILNLLLVQRGTIARLAVERRGSSGSGKFGVRVIISTDDLTLTPNFHTVFNENYIVYVDNYCQFGERHGYG
jgi:hypothetical protein